MDGAAPKSVGLLIDEAMELIMTDNKSLAATLPRIYNRDNVDQRRLGELLDLFNSARFTGQGASKARDLLGEVYEYFLEKFAKAEGKRGGEFYTPAGVVRVLVEVLEPHRGRVYDPAADRAACSSRPRSSSPRTTWRARTSPSMARS
jgi:type I restriction enzyme M protein